MKTFFAALTAGVATLALVGCVGAPDEAGESAPQNSAEGITPESLGPDYVLTPAGYYHKSCIHDIGDDATVDDGDVVTRSDGSHFTLPDCAFPHYLKAMGATADSIGEPTVNGWVVDGERQVSTWIRSMFADWIVPPAPSRTGGLIYFFPGIEPASFARILQPVLQYGNNGGFGDNHWYIASWSCGKSCPHSTPKRVHAGDTIHGHIVGSHCKSGVCGWEILAKDTTTGVSTKLAAKVSSRYEYAFNALEAYHVSHCDQYPNTTKGVHFQNIDVFKGDFSEPSGAWNVDKGGFSPTCSRRGTSSGPHDVHLLWNP